MELGEKLQQLRKERGLTQEELAERLFVSRTAVSKWESGRGYPGIDSLKALSSFFSVSIDDLLSAEALLTLAQAESRTKRQAFLGRLFAVLDLWALGLILLPLYPEPVDGQIYAVNLAACRALSPGLRLACWIIFGLLAVLGLGKLLWPKSKAVSRLSMVLGIGCVLLTAAARLPYAAVFAFGLLAGKAGLLYLEK